MINTSDATFEADVFEKSKQIPVLVDFWADWCAPCRQLGPLLEELEQKFEGQFLLVKANTEEAPKASTEFNVQSIPAVYGVVNGDVVDFFVGILPPDQLETWIKRLIESFAVVEANNMEECSPDEAAQAYRNLLKISPNDDEARIGLARVLFALEDFEACRDELETLERRGFLEPEAERIKSQLDLLETETGDLDEACAAAEAAPDNAELQIEYARALVANDRHQDALEVCLKVIDTAKFKPDLKASSEAAKELMLTVFRVLPDDSELTTEYRRKLSMLLY